MTTRPRTRLTGVAAVFLGACGLLAACGDDDDAATVSTGAIAESADTTAAVAGAADTTEATDDAGATTAGVTGTVSMTTEAAGDATVAMTDTTPTSGDSAPGSTASTSEVCAARDDLADSVAALGSVSISDVRSSGVSAISDSIGDVKDDLGVLGSAAGAELRSQVGDVQDAIGELETAVQAVGDGGGVRPAISALGNVVSTAGTLLTSLGTRCPTATSTPASAADSTSDSVATTAG